MIEWVAFALSLLSGVSQVLLWRALAVLKKDTDDGVHGARVEAASLVGQVARVVETRVNGIKNKVDSTDSNVSALEKKLELLTKRTRDATKR